MFCPFCDAIRVTVNVFDDDDDAAAEDEYIDVFISRRVL